MLKYCIDVIKRKDLQECAEVIVDAYSQLPFGYRNPKRARKYLELLYKECSVKYKVGTENEIVGFIFAHFMHSQIIQGNIGYIAEFALKYSTQGLGIGKRLFAYTLRKLIKDYHCKIIALEVFVENLAAKKFYEKFFFIQTSWDPPYYQMSLILDSLPEDKKKQLFQLLDTYGKQRCFEVNPKDLQKMQKPMNRFAVFDRKFLAFIDKPDLFVKGFKRK